MLCAHNSQLRAAAAAVPTVRLTAGLLGTSGSYHRNRELDGLLNAVQQSVMSFSALRRRSNGAVDVADAGLNFDSEDGAQLGLARRAGLLRAQLGRTVVPKAGMHHENSLR